MAMHGFSCHSGSGGGGGSGPVNYMIDENYYDKDSIKLDGIDFDIIEDENSEIFIPVGVEAQTFVPLRKELSDKDFEQKIKDTFGI